MRLLLSAYACAPGIGSEPEVGLRALDAALPHFEVHVLTQQHMVADLQAWLDAHPLGRSAQVHGVAPDAPVQAPGLRALAASQASHERWQRAAAREAHRLHAEVGFDLVHHVTLAAYWMRTGVAELDVPLVWGPVGGAVDPPWGLWPVLGLRGAVEDVVRSGVRRACWRRPSVRAPWRRAAVVLAQNAATARRLSGAPGRVQVLPNALCARVDGVAVTAPRRTDVAVVGRLVAWKGVPLAVRALAGLPDRTVRLRLYGDAGGRELDRVLATARAAGVADRVDVVGRLPRAQLLEAVATSGVVLHPSLHDEASFTVAEALALGTPVVLLAHGGPPDVAAHWPGAAVRAVRPTTPGRTARRLAAAVDELLDPGRPVAAGPVPPTTGFAESLAEAWRHASGTRS